MKNPSIGQKTTLPTLRELPEQQRVQLQKALKAAGFEAVDLDAIPTQTQPTSKGLHDVVAVGLRSIANTYYGSEEPKTSSLVSTRTGQSDGIVQEQKGGFNVENVVPQALQSLPKEVREDKALMQQLGQALLDLAKT